MHDEKSITLIEEARRGNRAALEGLLVRHLPSLNAYVRLRAGRLVRTKESLSDVAQSVCREILRQLDDFQFRGEPEFRHWLFRQASHKILNRKRHYVARKRDAARDRSAVDEGELLRAYSTICTPVRSASAREQLERFERAFERLPDDYRQAITLHRLIGLDYGAIAAEMGRSEGAIRNLVYRGLARLSNSLG